MLLETARWVQETVGEEVKAVSSWCEGVHSVDVATVHATGGAVAVTLLLLLLSTLRVELPRVLHIALPTVLLPMSMLLMLHVLVQWLVPLLLTPLRSYAKPSWLMLHMLRLVAEALHVLMLQLQVSLPRLLVLLSSRGSMYDNE
jgi:hypothetical protein